MSPLLSIEPLDTRFEYDIIQHNWFARMQKVGERTRRWVYRQQLDAVRNRRFGFHGSVKRDPQYQIFVDFSEDDGKSFSEPLYSIEGNRIYQIRMKLSQFQAEPLLHGFAIEWFLPAGWVFTDNLPDLVYDVAASNPLVVTRTAISPVNPAIGSAVKLVVRAKFE